jgi:hypothetical protein
MQPIDCTELQAMYEDAKHARCLRDSARHKQDRQRMLGLLAEMNPEQRAWLAALHVRALRDDFPLEQLAAINTLQIIRGKEASDG